MMALKGMKMNNKFLFDCIKEEFGRELRTDINYPFVADNLNHKLKLRAYQKRISSLTMCIASMTSMLLLRCFR